MVWKAIALVLAKVGFIEGKSTLGVEDVKAH